MVHYSWLSYTLITEVVSTYSFGLGCRCSGVCGGGGGGAGADTPAAGAEDLAGAAAAAADTMGGSILVDLLTLLTQ